MFRSWLRFLAVGAVCAGQLSPALAQPAPADSPPESSVGEDVVLLKDGTRLSGVIVRQEPGQFVVLRTNDGKELTLSWDDVRRVERASTPPPPAPAPAAASPVMSPPPTSPTPAPGAGPPGAAPPPGAPMAPQGSGVQPAPLGASAEVTFEDAEARRRAWLAKGGGIVGYEVRGYGMFVLLPAVKLKYGSETFGPLGASSSVEEREERGIGGGGGAGFRVAYMSLSLPDPQLAGTWTALRVASGLDFSYAYIGFPTQVVQVYPGTTGSSTVYGTEYQGVSLMVVNVPLQLGGMIGLGSFDGTEWRGVALSASWAPSFSYTKVSEGDGNGDFNYAGFELSIDILGKDGPLEAQAPRAHGKVFAFLLPPVGDLPLVATLGGGAVWY